MSSKFPSVRHAAGFPKDFVRKASHNRRAPRAPSPIVTNSWKSEQIHAVIRALQRGERVPTTNSTLRCNKSRDFNLRSKPRTVRLPDPRRTWLHSLVLYRRNGTGDDISERAPCTTSIPAKPMLNWVQVVSAPTVDTPGACVLLSFENRRYVFGHMAEGTQRAMSQRRMQLAKAEDLFLTGPVTWGNYGGLLGFILTVADVVAAAKLNREEMRARKLAKNSGPPRDDDGGVQSCLKIRGPENLTHMLATARRFIFRKGLPLSVTEIRPDAKLEKKGAREPDFQDANVQVWYVSLVPEAKVKSQSRKRSHDDMVSESNDGISEDTAAPVKDDTERKLADRGLVESVIKSMFDSDWELEALVETTLHQVNLPAAIFVKGEDGEVTKYTGPMPGGHDEAPDIPVLVRKPWPAARVTNLPKTTPSRQSLCYIVKGQPRRGKFNLQEATRLGVDRREFKLLTMGQTVKGTSGIEVTPDMCVGKPIEGRAFAVIDLPDASYIEPLLSRPEWSDNAIMGTMDIIYWSLGAGVVTDPRMQEFMKTHKSIRHTVFGPDSSPNLIALESTAAKMIQANRIDPDRFPLPVFSNTAAHSASELYTTGRVGAKLQMAPRVVFQEDEVVPLMDTVAAFKSMPKGVIELADTAREKNNDPEFLANIEETEKDIPNRDAVVIPLGTGSAMPSKYRNVSATLVRVPGFGSYLFDCGENTLGQLRRMYGSEAADEILRDLKVIWISHLHADHHLGTASLIRAWRDATASSDNEAHKAFRLAVASHHTMIGWLREYADVEDFGFDRLRLVTINGPNTKDSISVPVVFSPDVAQELGITRIDSTRVDHCFGALAVVFTWPTGFKVAYSGDCRPSQTFARIGEGATLLIHESTLDDELMADALAKKHCTMSEALEIARDMKARRVLLTHFSQRYPKIPSSVHNSNGNNGVNDQVVLVAFDQMHVKLGDFKKAELFLPALKELLEEDKDDK